jgi:hypothetical protein
VSVRPALLACAVALAAAITRGDDEVTAQAVLHARSTRVENVPGTAVLFDRAGQSFELSRYLLPTEGDRYGSAFASFSLQGAGLGGDLVWRLALDTGELRRRSFQQLTTVCWTEEGTGLSDSGGCDGYPRIGPLPAPGARPVRFTVEDTRLEPSLLTANGRPLENEVRATALVREAYAALSFGRAGFATVRAGRKRISVADGFVYDDYATGAELALDVGAVGPPFSVTASIFQPTRDFPKQVEGISPLTAVRVDYLPSLFEHAGVFLAAHRDRTGSVAELFRGALVERAVAFLDEQAPGTARYRDANHLLAAILGQRLESDATLGWLGTSGRLSPWRRQRLGWTAAILRGRIDRVSTGSETGVTLAHDVALRGGLVSASWNTDLGNTFGLGASFLHLSGGTFPTDGNATGTYGGFLGVAPFVTATNLFFGGGLSESFAARQSTAPGVNGRGVTAPGLSLTFDPTDELGLEVKGAYLTAPVKGPFGGHVYGTELDLGLSWSPRRWLVLGAELDVLWPGSFYVGRDTVYKTILAVDVVTP